jgi:DNA-binding transcriptional LysR family regulator
VYSAHPQLSMVSLRQLECLVGVVEAGSFTRAAELLHITQPALSHQVRSLERVVGSPLFERLPRSVRPTAAGRAMLLHARSALADAGRAVSAARQVSGLDGMELQISTVYSVSLGVLPPVLRAWRQSRGRGVDVRLFEHRHADELSAAMAAGEADLAVGPVPIGWTGPVHPIGVEEFVVVVAADDPMVRAGATRVELTSLADRDWVHYAPSNGLAGLLERACVAAGFQPKVAIRTEQTAPAPVLAASGLGPALVPANIVPSGFEGGILRPDPPIRRGLVAYARGRLEPVAAAFVETLLENACITPRHVRAALGLAADQR